MDATEGVTFLRLSPFHLPPLTVMPRLLDRPLRLFVPVATPSAARFAEAASVHSVIATPNADLAAICDAVDLPVTACLLPLHAYTPAEVDEVLNAGASTVLLPGAKCAYDVKMVVDIVRGRARTLVWIDTPELVADMDALRHIRWDAAHVDLAALSDAGCAQAFVDDATKDLCAPLRGRVFGLGCPSPFGASAPGVLAVSQTDRIRAACRLGASLLVLAPRDADDARAVTAQVASARAAWVAACFRSTTTVERDHELLQHRLGSTLAAANPERPISSGDSAAQTLTAGDGLGNVPDLSVAEKLASE